jgi:hypothetical protein
VELVLTPQHGPAVALVISPTKQPNTFNSNSYLLFTIPCSRTCPTLVAHYLQSFYVLDTSRSHPLFWIVEFTLQIEPKGSAPASKRPNPKS